jgi:hypothetical protein
MTHGFSTEQVLDTDVTLSFDSDYIAASQRATKTFVENSLNARLSAADATDLTDGGTTTLHSHSGGSGHVIQEEGSPLTARANLNFVGADVTATDDAGNNATIITIASAGSGLTHGQVMARVSLGF